MPNSKPMNGAAPAPVEVPPFVRRREEIEDESRVEAWDGWSVESTGDRKKDYALGQHYADLAVKNARANGNPAGITFPLSSIYLKHARGLIQAGEIERGFVERIASLAMSGALN